MNNFLNLTNEQLLYIIIIFIIIFIIYNFILCGSFWCYKKISESFNDNVVETFNLPPYKPLPPDEDNFMRNVVKIRPEELYSTIQNLELPSSKLSTVNRQQRVRVFRSLLQHFTDFEKYRGEYLKVGGENGQALFMLFKRILHLLLKEANNDNSVNIQPSPTEPAIFDPRNIPDSIQFAAMGMRGGFRGPQDGPMRNIDSIPIRMM